MRQNHSLLEYYCQTLKGKTDVLGGNLFCVNIRRERQIFHQSSFTVAMIPFLYALHETRAITVQEFFSSFTFKVVFCVHLIFLTHLLTRLNS